MANPQDVAPAGVDLPLIGEPRRRYEARAKVTGATRYAADEPLAGTLHAQLITTPVARGRITAIDTTAATALPGVRLVLTHETARAVPTGDPVTLGGALQSSFYPLSGPEVRYAGQIVGLAVAETIEGAREAARLVEVSVSPERAAADMHAVGAPAAEVLPAEIHEPLAVGDLEATLAAADAAVNVTYTTPPQHANPIELYFTSAEWQNGQLTAYVPSQWVNGIRGTLAQAFGLPTENVRVVSRYVGGAFGSKTFVLAHTIAVADAARQLGAPVKLYVSRQQFFTVGAFRAGSTQRVRLGGRGGRLSAIRHENTGQTSRFDTFVNAGSDQTVRMYDFDAVETEERMVYLDTNTPGFMRAPAEMQSMFALESAVDELAYELGVDPLELRLASDSDREPVGKLPWTSRSLNQCLRRGAELFGWAERPAETGTLRRDGLRVGYGLATTYYPTNVSPATATVRLAADLSCRVSAAGCDIGTGAYTVFQQLAAAELGLSPDRVRVELGDSGLAPNSVAGGSKQTASIGSAVQDACRQVRTQLAEAATAQGGPLEGVALADVAFENGSMSAAGRSVPLSQALGAVPFGVVEALGTWRPTVVPPTETGELYLGTTNYTFRGYIVDGRVQAAFGAQFVEVTVDPLTGEIRVPRMVGVFAAGRILNARTAHSQLIGGMIWGVGSALHEATEVDARHARFLNTDLAEYLVAVNADVPSVTAEIIEEVDEHVNPLGVKGIGEIGVVGVAAAIANAVYHATGKRVRDLPMRMEDVL